MKKSMKRIAVLLVITLLAPAILHCMPFMKGLTSTEAYAATAKAKLEGTKTTIGISSTPGYVYIENMKDKAAYSYKSKDTKIATVDKHGNIKGVKKGTTTITVSEKYKGKTITVGNVKVSVVGGKLVTKELEVGVGSYAEWISMNYTNSKATYKFKSSDSKTATVDESGFVMGVKAGNATISVSETYKGKTTKLGSVKVKVVEASISEDYSDVAIGVNSQTSLTGVVYIERQNQKAKYTAESADTSIVSCETVTDPDSEEEEFVIKGVANGTTTLTVYEEYKGNKRAMGTVNVTVKEIALEDFAFYSDDLDIVKNLPTIEYELGDEYPDWSSLEDLFEKDPYDASAPITYVSGDEAIVKVDSEGNVTPVAVGTTKITVSCGKFSYKIQIIVNPSEDDSEDYDY